MAEKLLGAIAKGTYKATTDPIKSAAKQAFDPNIMRTVYRAGIIGPLVKSIVSEYKRGEPEKDKQAPIVKDVSRNLQSLNSQISSLTTIMADIRELTENQLQLQKNIFVRNQRDARKADLEAVEEKLERTGSGIIPSSNISAVAGNKQSGGLLSGLGGFIKENPIISALIAGGLLISAKSMRDFVGGFIEGIGGSKIVKDAAESFRKDVAEFTAETLNTIKNTIKSAIREAIPDIIKPLLPDSLSNILNNKSPQEISQSDKSFGGALAGAGGALLASRLPFLKSILGRSKVTTGMTTVTGAALGSGEMDLVEALALAGYVGLATKLAQQFNKTSTPTPTPQAPPRSVVIKPSPSTLGGGKLTPLERSKSFPYGNIGAQPGQPPRPTVPSGMTPTTLASKLSAAIKKVGQAAVIRFFVARVGVGAVASMLGGPVGILLWLITLGPVAYQLLDELLQSADKLNVQDGSVVFDKDGVPRLRDYSGNQTSNAEEIPQPVKPSIIASQSSASTDFEYDQYRQKVMMLESGGQNVPNKLGSSAYGKYQVTEETFNLLKQKDSALQNITFDQYKGDTNIQDRVFETLTSSNAADLERNGIEPNAFNLYLAHRLGSPAALKLLKAKPDESLIKALYGNQGFAYMSKVYNQNPDMQNKTVGQWTQERMMAFGSNIKGVMKVDNISADTTTPLRKAEEQLDIIKGLRAIQEWAAGGNVTYIDQSQSPPQPPTSAGGGNGKRSQTSTVQPFSVTMEEERSLFFGGPGSVIAP